MAGFINTYKWCRFLHFKHLTILVVLNPIRKCLKTREQFFRICGVTGNTFLSKELTV